MTTYDQTLSEIRVKLDGLERLTLKTYFQVGDLILRACITLSLQPTDIIRRLQPDLGLVSTRTIWNYLYLARAFTVKQRSVLLNACVPVCRCLSLATQEFDGRRRDYLNKIKSGRIKAPWSLLETKAIDERQKREENFRSELRHRNGDDDGTTPVLSLDIFRRGEVDHDRLVDLLANLIGRAGMTAVESAYAEARKRIEKKTRE